MPNKYIGAACFILSAGLMLVGAALIDVDPLMPWWQGISGVFLIAVGAALPGLLRSAIANQAAEKANEETARLRHALRRARRSERLARKGKQ